jgi:hypothetical protein
MKAKRKAHGKFVKTLPVRSVLQNGGDTKMEADADVKDIAVIWTNCEIEFKKIHTFQHAFSEIIAPGVAKTNRPPQKKYKTEPKSRKQEEFFVQSKASDFHSEAGYVLECICFVRPVVDCLLTKASITLLKRQLSTLWTTKTPVPKNGNMRTAIKHGLTLTLIRLKQVVQGSEKEEVYRHCRRRSQREDDPSR